MPQDVVVAGNITIDKKEKEAYNRVNFVETGGRRRPLAEKTLENPVSLNIIIPRSDYIVQVSGAEGARSETAESLRQKDGDILKD